MSDTPNVKIRLFGTFAILVDGVYHRLGIAGATRSLLNYLVCFPNRPVRRDLLIELFWQRIRHDRRRSALNSAIWRIKKALAAVDGLQLEATADSIGLSMAASVECDVARLTEAVQGANGTELATDIDFDTLARALDVCEGPLLDGLDDEWALIERERLSAIQLRGLTLVMRSLAEQKRYDEALDYGRRIMAIDPYRESTLREVMCLYVMSGQRAKALRLFDCFATSLEGELGISPMAETLALQDYIANDLAMATNLPPDKGRQPQIDWPRQLDAQLALIERTRLELFRSMRRVTT